jgi:hypothetical protein
MARDPDVIRPRPKPIGQLEQDAQDLFTFAILERDDVVVDLDGRRRFHEQRGAGGRCAVHNAGHAAAMFGAHHQHEAPVALGDDLVLQVFRRRAASELFQRAAQLLTLLPQLVADAFELRAGLVEDLAARIDRLPHRVHFRLECGDVRD